MRKERVQSSLATLFNVAAFLAVVLITLALRKGWIMRPIRSGFFCTDVSIRYPVKEESVATNLILTVGSVAAFVLISVSEIMIRQANSVLNIAFLTEKEIAQNKPFPDSSSSSPTWTKVLRLSLTTPSSWLRISVESFLMYLLGLSVTVLLVEAGKIWSGVLRPNFWALCQPNVNCSIGDPYRFHTDYRCGRFAGESADEDNDAEHDDSRKSFPSGHAAVVAYIATFISCFLHHRRRCFLGEHLFMLRPFLQTLCISVAWVTSLTRVSDHVHHVSDVIVGLILGVVIAVWTTLLVADLSEKGKKCEAVIDANLDKGNICNSGGDDEDIHIDNIDEEHLEMSPKSCNASHRTEYHTPIRDSRAQALEKSHDSCKNNIASGDEASRM